MATFKFEELDSATHKYLVAVRDSEGVGAPGIFASTSDSLPVVGCIVGPILIAATLLITLLVSGIIKGDPLAVALLQTAGLLVGGWLLAAAFRGAKGSNRVAGNWVYIDPLFLYQAYREEVTITPVDEVVEARVTHNFNNDAYQNSTLSIMLAGNAVENVTVNNENRADQMRVFLNYLAWARGSEGGERAKLEPATLGGLAKYVAKNGDEPLDAERNINLSLIELDITDVPEDPKREGRALPAIFPYILLILYAAGCFLLMGFVVNPPLRDDVWYEQCTQPPLQPTDLRSYFLVKKHAFTNEGLTGHRNDILQKLSTFYDPPIRLVKDKATNPELRDGMVKMLEAMRIAEQPVASVQVIESGLPDGAGKSAREDWVRTEFAKGVSDVFGQQQPAVQGAEFVEPPQPIGHQLIAFVKKDEDMPEALFDIRYTFLLTDNGRYRIRAQVTIRTEATKPPVATGELDVPGDYSQPDASPGGPAMLALKKALVEAMVGPLPK